MKQARDQQRSANAESFRNRVQARSQVKLIILARIKDVETAGPQQHYQREQERHWAIQMAAHGYPCARWRNRQTPTKKQMREQGPTFRIRIKHDARQRDW